MKRGHPGASFIKHFLGHVYHKPIQLTTSLLLVTVMGCGNQVIDEDANIDPQATVSEANFYEIPPVSFSFQKKWHLPLYLTSSTARIFYSYHPAEGGPVGKPLFVMLNGGPGCATTLNLFSMNTAPYTLDMQRTEGNLYAANPYRWTQMGNLLYIDAPNAGFSYNTMDYAWSSLSRLSEFGVSNYNPFVDAAQVIRVILKFLDEHPGIGTNEVILVGESYGGTRVSTMLNMLLFHSSYGDGSRIYQDKELVAAIDAHFKKMLPDGSDGIVTPQVVAQQFHRQILIQPQLTGPYQDEVTKAMYEAENSVIDQVLGYRYSRLEIYPLGFTVYVNGLLKKADIDQYISSKPNTWSDDLEAHSMEGLLDVTVLSKVTGVDVTKIEKLKPGARRAHAYRYFLSKNDLNIFGVTQSDEASLQVQGWVDEQNESDEAIEAYLEANGVRERPNSLEKVFGSLHTYDDYLSGTNKRVYITYMINTGIALGYDISPDDSPIFGEMFLQNLTEIRTFMTDSALDLVIYSPALPESIKKYSSIVSDVDVARGTKDTPDGSFTIKYKADSLGLDDIETPDSVTIYWPYYSTSGHSVSSAQPDKFLNDVINWLKE